MTHRATFFSTAVALVVLGSIAGAPGTASGQSSTDIRTLSTQVRQLLKKRDLAGARLAIQEACFLRPDDVALRRQLRALEVKLAKQHYTQAKNALAGGWTDRAVKKLLSSYALAPSRNVSARLSKLGYRLHLGYWRTPEEIADLTETDARAEADARVRLRLGAEFRVLRTAHFRVFTNLPAGRREDRWMKPALKVLESTRESFYWLFAADVNADASSDGLDIVMFRRESDYRDHLDVRFGFRTSGYYCHRSRAAFFYRTGSYADLWRVLIHETVHQLSDLGLHGAYPTWISEGIATYFETAVVRKDHSLLIGRPHLKRLALLRANGMRDGNYIPAHRLFRARSMSEFGKGSRVKQAYAQSWGWAYFLLHSDPENRVLLLRCLRRERAAVGGQDGDKDTRSIWVETFEQNGLQVDELDAIYKKFIRSIRFDGKRRAG